MKISKIAMNILFSPKQSSTGSQVCWTARQHHLRIQVLCAGWAATAPPGTCTALSPLQSASSTTWGPWDSASMVAGARDSPAVILGVHRRPPHFAKSGRRAGPHLSPRSFPRRSRSHASEVRQTREPGQPLVVSAFGDCDFLNDVSLPSLCRNSCRPQQEALPALHSWLLRQLRCLQVRRGSSCQALCSKMLIGVRKALDCPAWSTRVLGLIPSV